MSLAYGGNWTQLHGFCIMLCIQFRWIRCGIRTFIHTCTTSTRHDRQNTVCALRFNFIPCLNVYVCAGLGTVSRQIIPFNRKWIVLRQRNKPTKNKWPMKTVHNNTQRREDQQQQHKMKSKWMKMTTNEKLLYLKSLTIYFIAAPFAAHRSTFTRRVSRGAWYARTISVHTIHICYTCHKQCQLQ